MGFHYKKSLGQHFLNDENMAQQIVNLLNEFDFNNLLEIGPGGGVLTKYILTKEIKNVKFVELDEEKIGYLIKMYPFIKPNLIHADFLKLQYPFEAPCVIIGNFPYNISSQIIFKIIEWFPNIIGLIGMFQKELAERLVAKPNCKEYGVISVFAQYFFEIECKIYLEPHYFTPPPKVDSAVILCKPIINRIPIFSYDKFKLLIKTSFEQRRKMLRNPCKNLFSQTDLQHEIFSLRAENLSVKDFATLSFKMI